VAGTDGSVPRVIVVGPAELHAHVAAFPDEWDAQQPVANTAALWSAFASGAVDPASPYIVFAASAASSEQISGAIIAMLPTAKPFVLVDNIGQLVPYQQAVVSAATSARADPSSVAWAATPYDLIAVLRAHLASLAEASRNAYRVPESSEDSFGVSDVSLPDAPAVKPFIASQAVPAQAAPERPANSSPPASTPTQQTLAPSSPATPIQTAPPQSVTPVQSLQPTQSAPSAGQPTPQAAPINSLNPVAATAQDTVVVSPAAAHLPKLVVSAAANPRDNVDKTVPIPAPLPGQVTVAVTSSKGGSGKSTTALMLATTIAQTSRAAGQPLRVGLVDLDARDGQISTLIGTYLPTAFNLWSAPSWDRATIEKTIVHTDDLGVDCLLAPARPRASSGVGTDFYRHAIRMLQSMYDVLILDTSANYLDPATWEVALVEASSILLVTTLANTAIQGMSRAVRDITDPVDVGGLGVPRERLSIVVNQSVAGVGIDMEFIVQAALHVPIVAAVPMATRDVLLATNHSAMQALLKHPFLGPAYFGLARAILPQLNLIPLVSQPPEAATALDISSQTVNDTSARETRTAASDELSSEQAPSNDATVHTVSSVLGS
jgi:cellulose biosynthesis protein BcsQ